MNRVLVLLLLVPLASQAAITWRFTGTPASAADGDVTADLGGTTDAGDLILCLARQRASTNAPTSTGYTQLKVHGSFTLLGKIAAGGDADPLIDFTTGAGNQTVNAQCSVWAGALNTVTGILTDEAIDSEINEQNITTPALTVTVDNHLVLMMGGKDDDWTSVDTFSGMTELGEPSSGLGSDAGIVWDYVIQTTKANISAGAFTVTGGATGVTQSMAVSLKPAVAAPTWSVEATVTVQDENDYTLDYTPSVAATFYAVACKKDSTAPTIAQVKAGNCTGDVAAVASVNEAVTGADTTVLGGSLTLPIHDLYAVLNNASGDSTLVTLADEMLDAPTDYQYDLLASVSATSPCKELNDIPISPTIAAADVAKWSAKVSPGNEDLTVETDCDTSYIDPTGSWRSATLDVYDTSVGDWMSGGPTTVYYNYPDPTCSNDCVLEIDGLIDGVAFDAVDICAMFADPAGGTLTCTSSDTGTGTGADKRPAGTTVTDGVLDDTGAGPTSTGITTGTFDVVATNVAGGTATVEVTWTVYDQVAVPDCVAGTLSDCIAAAEALDLSVSFASQCHATVPALDVLSQDPAATTSVDPFTLVDLVVSAGGCGKRRAVQMGLGIGVN